MGTATALAIWLLAAQFPQPPAPPPPPPKPPKQAATIDVTGDWVSVVTEDWRWRMVVPKKGDYASIPLSPAGKKVADTWDPKDLATNGCKPYGAAALMRVPGRLHIEWQDENTLRIEADAGKQTRILHFNKFTQAERTWQGNSAAEWDKIKQPGGLGVAITEAPPKLGSLKVVTTNMKPGFYRKNGVPYSEDAVVTEYFDRMTAFGTDWLTVFTIVDDPKYLDAQYITSTHFKREPDRSKQHPVACE